MKEKAAGLLALSPLFVFLCIYFVSSLIVGDFYKIPVASAFLVASIFAIIVSKGSISERIECFSKGAGNPNIMMMIWIFILAGAFAGVAKQIGAIDATVDAVLGILPPKMIYAGLFIAACFMSMSVGTSVGTIAALMPIASGVAQDSGLDLAYTAAIIVGGVFFGDNLSFISDTTIAATRSVGCKMSDKFKANIRFAGPAALVVIGIYIWQGMGIDAVAQAGNADLVKLIPYLSVIVLSLCGMNVMAVLSLGIVLCAIIGFAQSCLSWDSFLGSAGSGVYGMGELIIVTLLAGGMFESIQRNGGLDFLITSISSKVRGCRGAELCIAALVSLANIFTANNTIAILTTGKIASDITSKYGIAPRRAASILDTFSCLIQGVIPYGAQLLMASALSGVAAMDIVMHLIYPPVLGAFALASIFLQRHTIPLAKASDSAELLSKK